MSEKIITFKGGLGNQLFQYSFYLFLKKFKNDNIKLDTSWYYKFNNKKKRNFILNDILSKEIKTLVYNPSFFKIILSYRTEKIHTFFFKKNFFFPINFYSGYWQDIFFAKFLKKNFLNKKLYKKIENLPKVYYAIHGRFGDYITSQAHRPVNFKYFNKAINKIKVNHFYAVSDDINYMKKITKGVKAKITFLHLNQIDSFRFLYNAKGGIASNSTFCWWQIFLSKNKNWIFPKMWLKNSTIYSENLYIPGTKILDY